MTSLKEYKKTKMRNNDRMTIYELFEAYFRGDLSPDTEAGLIEFVRSDPQAAGWIEDGVAGESGVLDPEKSIRMLQNIHREMAFGTEQPRSLRRQIVTKAGWIAAAMLLPLLAVFITLEVVERQGKKAAEASAPVTMSVDRGQKAKITLPDGSRVWLNSNTEISYAPDFNTRERNVTLSGEAYFEVTDDTSRPFNVFAHDVQVRVLGTEFNVKAYGGDRCISTTLLSGGIEAITPDGTVKQEPNQRLVYDRQLRSLRQPERVTASDYIGWIHNTLRFVNEPLEELVKTVERMYNIPIGFENDNLRNYRFTGTLPNTSLESILEVITISSPVVYRYDGNGIVLSEDKRRSSLFR